MPELSTVSQIVQIGKETTPGTGVAAGKLLQYTNIELQPTIEMVEFRPQGSKIPSTVLPGKDYSTLNITGQGSYSEPVYILSSLLKDVSATTSDTTAKTWLYEPAARSEEVKARYTIEQGSSTRAGKATYGAVTGAEFTFNRESGLTFSGSGWAQAYQDNIALTGSPAVIEEAPVLPTHLNVYVNSTFGAIGTTKLTRDFEAIWRCNDVVNQVWPINSANASYASDVDSVPTVETELTLEADSTGMALMTAVRAGTTQYVRLEALSTVLAGAATVYYKLWIDMACKVSAFPGFEDAGGVKVIKVSLKNVLDTTFSATAFGRVTVVNKTAAL